MVQIFYCVPVELENGKMWYWAEDTSIVCYSSGHKRLVFFAGVPLLVCVCLGLPTALLIKLHRRRHRLHTSVVVSRYGYFYQGYYAGFAYWGVLVQARKGLLAVISVLSGTLSKELKGYFASCVLLVAAALHTRCYPQKALYLNRMEAASLFVSLFACLFEGVTQYPEGHRAMKLALSVINIVLLIGFITYMAFMLVMANKSSIQHWLEEQEEYQGHTDSLASSVRIGFKILFSHIQHQMSSWRQNMGSLTSRSTSTGVFVQESNTQAGYDESGFDDHLGIPLLDFRYREQ